jgi:hypothetical protein
MKAKYIIISALFMSLWIGNLHAQNHMDDPRDVPAFGIKAGINVSSLYDTKGENFSYNSKLGFAGGIFLGLPFGRYLGFQPELIYSQKGYKGTGSITLVDYQYTRNMDFLDIPLQLQIKPSRYLTILAGPEYSFLLHKKLNFNSGDITVQQQTDIQNNNIRKNTFGVIGGLDINILPLVISGRVGWDLQRNNGDGTSSNPRFRNFWFQTTLGLSF